MNVNDKLHGFIVTKKVELKDKEGTFYEMQHEKTGALLGWYKTSDKNKTFGIGFRTIPSDDTGVFHILEHSVLNGSEKYPLKEPFVELLKGSLQTFLNAMTFPDKTMYPFSSRNDQDFLNLMGIYMDAVFCPLIYSRPNTFYQEGWHYEIHNEEEPATFKGVVFNEMKGAYSSIERLLELNLNRALFPDSPYYYSSGGDPVSIPNLTYEMFIENHKKFYHPSNSVIWLDGDVKIEDALQLMDEQYLSKYDNTHPNFPIPEQSILSTQVVRKEYPISKDESVEGKSFYAVSKIVGKYDEVEKNTAISILANILTDSNDAPLTKAILEKGLGKDVAFSLEEEVLQPYYVLMVRNTDPDKFEEIKKTVSDLAKSLVENGLDHDKIHATLNRKEFKYREGEEPQGLWNCILAFDSWLYGGDPLLHLEKGDIYKDLHEKCDQGYFEELLKELLLDEDHLLYLEMVPSTTLEDENRAKEVKRLEEAKASWDKDTLQMYIDRTLKLEEAQSAPDTKEALESLPLLALEDIDEEPILYSYKDGKEGDVAVRMYPEDSEEIRYLNFYFNLNAIPEEDLPKLALLCNLYTMLPTEKHSVEELSALIKSKTGRFAIGPLTTGYQQENDKCQIKLSVGLSSFKRHEKEVKELMWEVLSSTVFDVTGIKNRIAQIEVAMRQGMIVAGHSVAAVRNRATCTSGGVVEEKMTGYSYFKWIQSLLNDESKIQEVADWASSFAKKYLVKEAVCASVSGEDSSCVNDFVGYLYDGEKGPDYAKFELMKLPNEGIIIPSGVSYSSYGMNIPNAAYKGAYSVGSTILSYDYLWNEVRVQGGAYGTGFQVGRTMNAFAYSYRDPSPARSYEIFQKNGDYLENFEDNLVKTIIGTIGETEPVLSKVSQMIVTDMMTFNGVTEDDLRKDRKEILNASLDEIHEFGKLLKDNAGNAKETIVGPKEVLEPLKEKGFTLLSLEGE